MSQLTIPKAIFLQCDIQEKFVKTIYKMNSVIHTAKLLNRAAFLFKIPLIASQQLPKALGYTLPELTATYPKGLTSLYDKETFSMSPKLFDYWRDQSRTEFVLYGIEAHICILNTALDLRKGGFNVYVVTDGVSSSRPLDRSTGIRRMEAEGCKLNTAEGVLFEMLKDAKHPEFKAFVNLLKEKRPEDMLESL